LGELDIHRVIPSGECRKRSMVMNALVCADRNWSCHPDKRLIFSLWQRLFDESNASLSTGGKIRGEIIVVPALVRVHDKGRTRRSRARPAEIRAASPPVPSLIFNSARPDASCAAFAIASGASREIV